MRISTSQIYDAGALGIQRNQAAVFKTSNQISSGRRILTPADDPVAAAQALVVTQSQSVTKQHLANQAIASDQLALVDTQLGSLTDLLQSVRDRVVQAGNTTLANSDRQAIATEIDSRLGEMMGIANIDNGSGDYMFSGYKGGTLPFAVSGGDPISPAKVSPIGYFGDDGQRLLQVSTSQQMAINVAGSDLFMTATSGNGSFIASSASGNGGTGTVDAGSVLDREKWQAAVNLLPGNNPALQIKFTVVHDPIDPTDPDLDKRYYQLFDATPSTPVAVSDPVLFSPGSPISLVTTAVASPIPTIPPTPSTTLPAGTDFGARVVISGVPSDGDTFTITPDSSQSIFQTMQSLIGILRTPIGTSTYSTTQLAQDLRAQLTNVDQALDNVSQIRATMGTRMNELDSLASASTAEGIQYTSTLSDLQDLDYVKAITDFSKQQVNLEAAQKSFVQISGLSLFKYI
ncbi:flagellar hook-associated protein FlgL [Propionivibrio sp.]|uniref:flagellar hook-associated protein FlgL n=1 Tax=Propionivibrio sp. TaxID=2212460 RepID=UPI003BF37D6F